MGEVVDVAHCAEIDIGHGITGQAIAAWQVPLTVRLIVGTPAASSFLEVSQALIAKQI